MDQDNLHIKFSAWNVDFSSLSPDAVDSRRPAHVGVKSGYLSFVGLFSVWLQIGTAMLLIITSTDDKLLMNVNIDDLE